MRLINADMLRDKLKEIAHDRFNLSDEYGWFLKGLIAADDEIRSFPTFPNTMEIIRCKDCKHRYKEGEQVVINRCELNHNLVQSDEWFCADGVRRKDEAD